MRGADAASSGSRNFDLVVFDWDGTLVDSTGLIVKAIRAACQDLGQPLPDESAARWVIGLGFSSAVRHVAPRLDAVHYATFSAAYRRHYVAEEASIPLFDGAREMLRDLDRDGYRLAVATGKSRAGLDHALRVNGLAAAFHATRCADEGFPKPNPDMLESLMATLYAEPERTLMIGDTSHDMELARNAGARGLAVSYGAHPFTALEAAGPMAIVNSVAALRAWLARNG